jgi:hypothetical protein
VPLPLEDRLIREAYNEVACKSPQTTFGDTPFLEFSSDIVSTFALRLNRVQRNGHWKLYSSSSPTEQA